MSDTLKQIADNLGAPLVNGSYLNGIADYYGVDTTISTDLMADILLAIGGNPATSTDYPPGHSVRVRRHSDNQW